jgi:hypothetical protein
VALVGIAPGFDPRRYAIMAVDRCTVVESEIKDAEDREFARTLPAFLQAEVVRRLSATGLFESVINLTAAGPPARSDPALRLECVITRLAPGSEVGRSALWAYGVGRSKLEAEFRFVEAQTNRVVMVTADRRVALRTEDGEVTSDALLRESCATMARDLAKFLVRLSRGEAPRD